MTQAELEQIAKDMRARGLHSSWNELLVFSESVVGGLVDAYRALLKNSVRSGNMLSANPSDLQMLVRKKLRKALISLTSRAQVSRWESEALGSKKASTPRNNALRQSSQSTGLTG
jgi:hypothetical protein